MTPWTSRHWTGPHLHHPEWHWVWLTAGQYHKHGYGPTHAEALAMAEAAPAVTNLPVTFRRR